MLGDFLAGAGVLVACAAAAASILLPTGRTRTLAMVLALILIPVLIGGQEWNSPQISDLRDHPAHLAALIVAAGLATLALGAIFLARPLWVVPALVASVPFRVPLGAGGEDANLLAPLYLVIAAAIGAYAWAQLRESHPARSDRAGPQIVPALLAAAIGLYGLQAIYSGDFPRALQNVAFFYVPFALVLALMRGTLWDRAMLSAVAIVVLVEGLLFAVVGFVELSMHELLWNPQVITSNEFHTYFRVNSLFWDPNVYARFLAVAILIALAALLWPPALRRWWCRPWVLVVVPVILWLGLATTYSQSGYAALLAGMAVLGALRWSTRWTAVVCLAIALAGVGGALAFGKSLRLDFSSSKDLGKETSGRSDLVRGGLELFGDRPLWGYGSGSFARSYRDKKAGGKIPVSESHTEPVTVLAEQGLIGFALYGALIAISLLALGRGLPWRRPAIGGGSHGAGGGGPGTRAAILAGYVALLVHTLVYAGYLDDPMTWMLLAAGVALADAGATTDG